MMETIMSHLKQLEKSKAKKKSGLNRNRTHELCDTSAALLPTELSSQPEAGHLSFVTFVINIPVDGEDVWWIYCLHYINLYIVTIHILYCGITYTIPQYNIGIWYIFHIKTILLFYYSTNCQWNVFHCKEKCGYAVLWVWLCTKLSAGKAIRGNVKWMIACEVQRIWCHPILYSQCEKETTSVELDKGNVHLFSGPVDFSDHPKLKSTHQGDHAAKWRNFLPCFLEKLSLLKYIF